MGHRNQSEQDSLQSELAKSEARMRTILESEPECVKIVDANGCLLFMNSAGLRKIGAKDLNQVLGANLLEIVDAPYHQLFLEGLDAVYRGDSVKQQFTITGLKGQKYWMEQTSAPIYDPDDPTKVVEMVAVTRDIREQKAMTETMIVERKKAEAANAAKSRFLANISHELRTPMNGILGMASVLDAADLSEQQRAMVRTIIDSGDTLMTLLNDVLDLSRIEANGVTIEAIDFSINKLANKAIAAHAVCAAKKGIKLSVLDCDEIGNQMRVGDPHRILQIFTNLISNAIKFTSVGEVQLLFCTCEKYCTDEEIMFEITDTGIGISSEQQSRMFERFSQADESTTREYGGSGLGLSICKGLVELMGGRIELESELGKGSTFRVFLPLAVKAGVTAPAVSEKTAVSQTDHSGLSILIAEDNQTNQRVIQSMLATRGVAPTIVENGEEAVDAFKSGTFDLVLMDIQMPVLGGEEALEAIRRYEKATNASKLVPIVALTANALDYQVENYLALGFDAYLSKPVTLTTLFNMVDGMTLPVSATTAR